VQRYSVALSSVACLQVSVSDSVRERRERRKIKRQTEEEEDKNKFGRVTFSPPLKHERASAVIAHQTQRTKQNPKYFPTLIQRREVFLSK
jgi:hypothetical protein